MKFKEMSVEEFKKEFSNFLNKIEVEELISSLMKYTIIEKQYSYNMLLESEENYNIKYESKLNEKFENSINRYIYNKDNYFNEYIHREENVA